jgi:hypothetical protein
MSDDVHDLLMFAAGIILSWGLSWARTFLAKRVKNPNAEEMTKLWKAMRMRAAVQRVIIEALKSMFGAIKALARDKKQDAETIASMAENQVNSFFLALMETGEPEAPEELK